MKSTRFLSRFFLVGASCFALAVVAPSFAQAHPLGNFTTNTATRFVVGPDAMAVTYVVDLAEIPTVSARQVIDALRGVDERERLSTYATKECATLMSGLHIQENAVKVPIVLQTSTAMFSDGQAGLSTLRIACEGRANRSGASGVIAIQDTNFPDRQGWREVSAEGQEVTIAGKVDRVSPSNMLTAYVDTEASRNVRFVSFSVAPGAAAERLDGADAVVVTASANDGITERFQRLVARERLTIPFVVGALLAAALLGGLHALAPGHGKSLMAAYVLARRGGHREILTIGATVASTHTIGVFVLGALVSGSKLASPDRLYPWFGVASGAVVIGVGLQLLKSRWHGSQRAFPQNDHHHRDSTPGGDHAHHDHAHHDHDHGHDHASHDHGHDHASHGHDHAHHGHARQRRIAKWQDRSDVVVTTHSHGGMSHSHVLPAVGERVPVRQLFSMGIAGGLVPSPSALVVLLGAIAIDRIPFGLALVIAYGIGLAVTLVLAGFLFMRIESWLRLRVRLNRRTASVARLLPWFSAIGLTGGGALLVVRSLITL
jgi:nickel/cobalt transporter (NicO) family protein